MTAKTEVMMKSIVRVEETGTMAAAEGGAAYVVIGAVLVGKTLIIANLLQDLSLCCKVFNQSGERM